MTVSSLEDGHIIILVMDGKSFELGRGAERQPVRVQYECSLEPTGISIEPNWLVTGYVDCKLHTALVLTVKIVL